MKTIHPFVFQAAYHSKQLMTTLQVFTINLLMTLATITASNEALAQNKEQATDQRPGKEISAKEFSGPDPLTPLTSQPAARLIVDPPLPEQLAQGRVVLQYHTE